VIGGRAQNVEWSDHEEKMSPSSSFFFSSLSCPVASSFSSPWLFFQRSWRHSFDRPTAELQLALVDGREKGVISWEEEEDGCKVPSSASWLCSN